MVCKTCKHLAVTPNKAGVRVVRSCNSYRCIAPEPVRPAVPASAIDGLKWPPHRRWMQAFEGAACPFHEDVK